MWRPVLLLCFTAPLISANGVPLENILKVLGPSVSKDIIEDANLDVPELVTKYRYPLEVHQAVTPDGYILEMHRIPHGRDNNNVRDPRKPVVFIMHGLLGSSACYVLLGPSNGLGYILAEQGYDVWMGNARGTYYSRQHLYLNPDSKKDTDFWNFSWDEIGNIDLPTMIDYVLAKTGHSKLHYIGHSQGTTSFFVMGSLRQEYNSKIMSMHALAPVAYMAHNQNIFLKFIAPFSSKLMILAKFLSIGEFLPHSQILSWAGEAFCRDNVIFQPICSNILFLIGGWNEAQLNTTTMPIIFGHMPAGASLRQFAHYGQSIANKGFRRYDYGWLKNIRTYGSILPPSYELSKVTAPVFLHYSDSDPLAHVNDVETLWRQLGNPAEKLRVPDSKFSHLDFLWGIDVQPLVYNKLINIMKVVDNNLRNVTDS